MRSRAQSSYRQDLAGGALKKLGLAAWPLGGGARLVLDHHKVSLTAIDRQKIRDQFPGHGERRAIGIAFLFFSVIEQRQSRTVARRHLRCFDQGRLQMFVTLLGSGRALHPVRRTLLVPAQAAVADGFFDA